MIVNKTQVPESGTFITKRMLVGAPAGFEWGKKVAVTIVGTTAPFTRPQPGVRVRTARPWTKKSAHAAPAGSSVPSGENTASAGGASLPAVPGADGTTVGGPELEAGADASALLAELEAELDAGADASTFLPVVTGADDAPAPVESMTVSGEGMGAPGGDGGEDAPLSPPAGKDAVENAAMWAIREGQELVMITGKPQTLVLSTLNPEP